MKIQSKNTSPRVAKPLDHLVLPTQDLEVAKARLEALGFIVAPVGIHPFGTENACVYFSDGTFLEPLAIGQRETAEAATLHGNQFTARDAAFRFRRGVEGLSAIVMGSNDAKTDHETFVKAGISAGNILDFGRDFETPEGAKARMDFRLAFASDLRSPDFFGFTCERINVPKADRSKLIGHENGVVSIKCVVLTEPNPTDFQYLFQELIDEREVDAHSFGMDILCANSIISVLTHEGFEGKFGVHVHGTMRGLIARAIIFGTSNIAALRAQLTKSNIKFTEHLSRVIVAPTRGQGAYFVFEEVA